MAIKESAKKALRQSEKRRARNITYKNKLKKLVKETRLLVSQKNIDGAKKLFPKVCQAFDKTAKVGIIKKNTASRRKSRLSLLINKK